MTNLPFARDLSHSQPASDLPFLRAPVSPLPTRLSGARLVSLALVGGALTALVIGLTVFVDGLAQSGGLQAFVRVLILAAIVFGFGRGLAQAGLDPGARRGVWLGGVVPLLAWQAAVWWLAGAGVFQPGIATSRLLPVAIVLPVLIGLPVVTRSKRLGRVLDALPPGWLIGLQVFRVFGSVFLVGWAAGTAPGIFALPAGLGDTLVGLLALPVAAIVGTAVRGARAMGIVWNVLGIVDLVNAIALGVLTAAGPLQLIRPDQPNPINTFPLVLIPTAAVPLALLLHAASLRQLRRQAHRAGGHVALDEATLRSPGPGHAANASTA